MLKPLLLLIPCLGLAACQTTPRGTESWADFQDQVGRMDEQQLQFARETAMAQYAAQPSDSTRIRASYVLSRPDASLEQLAQSLEILAGISANSNLAPLRDLLSSEIQTSVELQMAQMRELELRTRLERVQGQLTELQTQLDSLKAIEQKMIESQQSADDLRP